MSYLVHFDRIDWQEPVKGLRTKSFIDGARQIRMVEFSEGFIEMDWCTSEHAGYVLEGEFSIDYSGELERYQKGDVIYIPKGERAKHKAVLKKGERVTLLLFEIME